MPAALSNDIRRRVFEARQSGETTSEVSERLSVSQTFVRKVMQCHRETGLLKAPESGLKRGRRPVLGEEDLKRLRELATQQPDLCAWELREQLGLSSSDLTVWRALKNMGFTFKKRQYSRRSRKGRM
jgi:transposase